MPETRRYRGQLYWLALGAVVLSMVMVLLLVFEVQQRNAIRRAMAMRPDSITALVFHFERDFLRLQRELDHVVSSSNRALNFNELRLRNELLLSRIALLRESTNISTLINRVEYTSVIPQVEGVMQTLGNTMEKAPIPIGELQVVLGQLDGLGLAVHALTLAANSQVSHMLEERENEAIEQNNGIIAISLAMLILLLGSSYAILVRLRSQESDRIEQARLLQHIQSLNDALEAKVADRTKAFAAAAQKAEESAQSTALALSLVEATLEATNNGILVVDLQGHITSTNQRFAKMWRIPDELIAQGDDGRVLHHAISQLKNPQEFLNKVEDLYRRPEAVSRDTLVFTDGRVFARFSHPQRINHVVVGRVWSFLDISDQVHAEERVLQLSNVLTEELDRSKQQSGLLQALLGAIPDMVWLKSPDGVFLSCNPAFEKLMGASTAQIMGKTDFDFFPPEVAQTFQSDDAAARQRDVPMVLEEWVNFRSDDRRVLLETTKVAVHDRQGALIGTLGVARDVTATRTLMQELEHAKREAQHSNEAKSMFLANMSHEIRTPMNAIIGMADLALRTELSPRQLNYISKIKRSSETLLHIINDILDFSKIEAGKMQIESIPFELDDVFEQLSSLMALRAENQGIELAYKQAGNMPPVLIGDPMRLGQVLNNLVSNALKFSAGGNVVVAVTSARMDDNLSELQFSVSDEGIGMTEEQISHLFLPFTQADASTTRRFGGTGLGLAISQHLIGLLGGRIWVESAVGLGSTFHFTVRFRHDIDRRRRSVAEFVASLAQKSANTVLIVDDNRVARNVLKHLVEQLGLRVIDVDSGDAALKLWAEQGAGSFLACLIDWFMPTLDGIETIRQLRSITPSQEHAAVPMILVTAHSQNEVLGRFGPDIDGLLGKPVSARNLYEELARCLGFEDAARQRRGWRKTDRLQWSRFHDLDILLAEDLEINREVMGDLLAGVGLHARFAVDGAEALQEVERKVPDLILMDCHMPGIDGYAATRQLRANPAYTNLPIIALTASAMAEDKRRCFAAGMNGFVTKPVQLEVLYEQMVQCVPQSAALTEDPIDVETDGNTPPKETPTLPGIDVALGLAQVGGKMDLLVRVLRKFRDNLALSFEPQFRAAIQSQDWSTVERLAHSLKGVSTTLGASVLAQETAFLEGAIRERSTALIAPQLECVLTQLQLVRTGLENMDVDVAADASKPLDVGMDADVETQLEKLIQMLNERDTEAVDLAYALAAQMAATPYREQWGEISEKIEKYAFVSAAAELKKMLHRDNPEFTR